MPGPQIQRIERRSVLDPILNHLPYIDGFRTDNPDMIFKLPRHSPIDHEKGGQMAIVLQQVAGLAQKLGHDNISHVSLALIDGTPALVMRWCPNGNILQYSKGLSTREKIKLIIPVAEALRYLNENGVVHGNVSSANVLIADSGAPQLSDISLNSRMRLLDDGGRLLVTHSFAYKSPQELDGGVNPATMPNDVFSFGSTLYEVLTGNTPCYRGRYGTFLQIRSIIQHQHLQLPRPSQVSPALWDIIQKCWAYEPLERYTMNEVVAALRNLNMEEQ